MGADDEAGGVAGPTAAAVPLLRTAIEPVVAAISRIAIPASHALRPPFLVAEIVSLAAPGPFAKDRLGISSCPETASIRVGTCARSSSAPGGPSAFSTPRTRDARLSRGARGVRLHPFAYGSGRRRRQRGLQRDRHVPRRREAIALLSREAAHDDVVDGWRQIGHDRTGPRDRPRQDRVDERPRAFTPE